jgi:hypothetical protein
MAQDGMGEERTGTWDAPPEPRVVAPFVLPDRWKLLHMLGRGGQAEVWLAEDTALGQQVAIKVFGVELSDVQRERIKREVRLSRDLEHPRLVRVFELLDLDGRPAAVMEHLSGGSVARLLDAGELPVERVTAITEDVLDVLAALHERGVVHRDVKPSNLLLDAGGRVHLTDLGLAVPLDGGERLTRTAVSVGTPSYMAPEQLRGAEPAPPADLYSLGCTLYQLLTGRLPFEGATEYEIAEAHLHRMAPDPRRLRPDCPAWLASFVLRLLEKRPQARWPDARAAARAFARRRRLTTPRFRRAAALAAIGIAVLAAFSLALLHQRPVPSRVTIAGETAIALDRGGHELWRVEAKGHVSTACVADFYGEGRPQVAIGELVPAGGQALHSGSVEIFDADARPRVTLSVASEAWTEYFPEMSPNLGSVQVLAADLNGDGVDDLVTQSSHDPWFPSEIDAWSPRLSLPPGAALVNSGRIFETRSADLDGDGINELVVVGINNPLGYQRFVAVIRPYVTRGAETALRQMVSPDHLAAFVRPDESREDVIDYAVLGPGAQPSMIAAGRDGIVARAGGGELKLDIDANPSGSPLYQQGPGARRAFWRLLAETCIVLESGKLAAGAAVSRVLESGSPALAERPMRVAAELMLARSLARTGDHAAAIGVLTSGIASDPSYTDLRLRLAGQEIIAGQTGAGVQALRSMIEVGRQGRSTFDPSLRLQLVSALAADAAGFALAEATFTASAGFSRNILGTDLRAVWAFDRGQWIDPSLDDDGATRYYPIAAVLRRWAALERGASPAEIVSAAHDLAANPERRELATLLEAHAEMRRRNADRSLALARQALDALDRRGRAELEMFVWTPLAHRLVADALLALGRPAEARPHLARAHEIAPSCWFGQTAASAERVTGR